MKLLIFTDLDGTLLNKEIYDYGQALPLVSKLRQKNHEVIFNSSKTCSEMQVLQKETQSSPVFAFENGGGIFWQGNIIDLGLPRRKILDTIEPLENDFKFTGFYKMTSEEVARQTGLNVAGATRARQRQFTEPIQWLDSDEKLAAFRSVLEQKQLQLLKGGRFYHIQGQHDKASAMAEIKERFIQNRNNVITIALGDAENDRRMLEQADHAIVLTVARKEKLVIKHHSVIYAQKEAPAGWAESLEGLLNSLVFLS